MRQHGVMAVDIKSRENMTPFARWDNADFIKPQIITKHFPYLCAV
jgi:hypothetical protein